MPKEVNKMYVFQTKTSVMRYLDTSLSILLLQKCKLLKKKDNINGTTFVANKKKSTNIT
mgnify:CR=1 FL=1